MQTCLIIDDSSDVHALLKARLKPEGLRLVHSLKGDEGLELARTTLPDIILLDVDMPDMNGFDVCSELKSDPRTWSIPVIFLTASDSLHLKVRAFDMGAVDYVTKPFFQEELRARVRVALRMKRLQDLLSERAQIDGRTGLWNDTYLKQRLEYEVDAARRFTRSLSLVLIDIDGMRGLNDLHGVPFGDRVIQQVSELLIGHTRPSDAVCRRNGDEFALVLTETDAEAATRQSDRLRRLIGELHFESEGRPLQVTASFGVAEWRPTAEADVLLSQAEASLAVAKTSGRNRVFKHDGV
jgi:two-component system cell cycle response regulator